MTDKIKQAQQLHISGQFKDAEALYQEVLQENPDQADVLHALAVLYAQTEKYDDALTFLEKAIKNAPHVAALYNSKGNIYLRLNKYTKAAVQYQKAIDIDAKYAVAYNNLGKTYYEQDQLDLARECYEQAITLNLNYSDAYYNLGILLAKLGEHDAAIEVLEQTQALAPQKAAAYGQLAEVYMHIGDYQNAIENYTKRIDIEPEHTETYHAIGQAYLHNQQFDEAIAAFEQTLALQPKHPECNHNIANAFLQSGDPSKAINFYFRQIEIEPIMESYYNIGVIFMHQNRHKESAQYLEHAAKIDPSYLPVYINLGALYLKMNRIPDAIKNYEHALAIKPDDVEIKHILTAISKGEAPDKAPAEYLENLFDQYATYYDKHLTEMLKYQAHELLYQAVRDESDPESADWTILDLGCGTGLCGALFKPFAKKMIGIDISKNMIALAKEKNIYDIAQVDDVEAALEKFKDNDFIVAGDVFSYIGKLDDIFKKTKAALKPNGLFAFTVEKTYTEPYELRQTIRYAHSRKYLESLIEANGFKTLRFDTIELRKQKNVPVEGYLLLLKP